MKVLCRLNTSTKNLQRKDLDTGTNLLLDTNVILLHVPLADREDALNVDGLAFAKTHTVHGLDRKRRAKSNVAIRPTYS